MSDITQMLAAVSKGEAHAADDLLNALYEELRRLAAIRLSQEKPGQTLQATALVHEAWMRLVGKGDAQWENRAHFFGAAAEAMRRILIDRARAKQSLKRGGNRERMELQEGDLVILIPTEDLLDVNDALDRLEETDPITAQVVKLRCFAGLTMDEIGLALQISSRTVAKHWAFAKARLSKYLSEEEPSSE